MIRKNTDRLLTISKVAILFDKLNNEHKNSEPSNSIFFIYASFEDRSRNKIQINYSPTTVTYGIFQYGFLVLESQVACFRLKELFNTDPDINSLLTNYFRYEIKD